MELNKLEKAITLHLELFKKVFKLNLSPKHHFLLHYPTVIRRIGPTIFYNMLRFDSKHRVLKRFRYATSNFRAINKTLALQHQKQINLNGFTYKDEIKWGNLKKNEFVINSIPLEKLVHVGIPIFETKFLHFNNYKYFQGAMIVHSGHFHEICHILHIGSDFCFVCKPYAIVEFDSFLNSFFVREFESFEPSFIHFSDLLHFKSYEKKLIQSNHYIISDSRDLHKNIVI